MAGPAGSHISNFRTKIKNIARANRFTVEVRFSTPLLSTLKDYDLVRENTQDPTFKYLATKASIPTFDIEGPVLKYRGTQMSLAGDYKREPLAVSFINDDNWKARKLFEDWMRMSVSHDQENQKNRLQLIRLDTTIVVKQFKSNTDTAIAEYLYHDAMPLKVSNIDLDHSEQNSIETFTVDFHYSHWSRAGETALTIPTKGDGTDGVVEVKGVLVVNLPGGHSKVIPQDNLDHWKLNPTVTGSQRIPIENVTGWSVDLITGGIDASKTSPEGVKQLLGK